MTDGLSDNSANSVQLELELGLSLAETITKLTGLNVKLNLCAQKELRGIGGGKNNILDCNSRVVFKERKLGLSLLNPPSSFVKFKM